MHKRILITFMLCVVGLLMPQLAHAKAHSIYAIEDQETADSTADEKIAHVKVTGLSPLEKDTIGWPAHYAGVMLQGFYWNSYTETKWTNLTAKADSVAKYFDLIWVPNAGAMAGDGSTPSMGYLHYKWFDLNSQTFGTAQQLRDMIAAYRQRGTGIIEDVVINHQCPVNDMELFYFPKETYNDKTYQLTSEDILTDDDGGKTFSEAKLRGKSLSPYGGEEALPQDIADDASNPRTESNTAGLDIDHRSKNVQEMSRTLTNMYLHDYGFAGLRYDVAAGYRPEHIVDYNYNSKPRFSIGEVWKQDSVKLNWWLNHWTYTDTNNSKHQVCASFDFPLKYHIINQAFKNSKFSAKDNFFSTKETIKTPLTSRYAVTFVDNHDTYWPRPDRSNDDSGPSNYLPNNVLAANAYILAMPGTPCIFLTHYLDNAMRPEIQKMIMARKAAGVTNMSRIIDDGYDPTDLDGYYCVTEGETDFTYKIKDWTTKYTTEKDTTSKATILFFAGDVNPINLNGHTLDQYTLISEGQNYKFYISSFAKDDYDALIYNKVSTVKGNTNTVYTSFKTKVNNSESDNFTTEADKLENHTPEVKQMLPKRTVFVRKPIDGTKMQAPLLYVWGSDGNNLTNYEPLGGYDANTTRMPNDTIVNGQEFWAQSFYVYDGYNVILHTKDDTNADQKYFNDVNTDGSYKNISGDIFLEITESKTSEGETTKTTYKSRDITSSVLQSGDVRRYNVYVRKDGDTAPYIYVKGSTGNELNGAWNACQATKTIALYDKTWWYANVSLGSTQTFDVNIHGASAEESKSTTTTYTGLKADVFFSWDATADKSADITEDVNGYLGHNWTVYVQQPAEIKHTPRLHAWEEGGSTLTAAWDSDDQIMTQTTTINGVKYWYKTFRVVKESYHVILHLLKDKDGISEDMSKTFDNLKSDVYFSWDQDSVKHSEIINDQIAHGETHKYTVYVKWVSDDTAPYLNAWDNNGSNNTLNGAYNLGSWDDHTQKPNPAQLMTETVTINDVKWWYKTLTLHPFQDTYAVQLHGWRETTAEEKADNKGDWQGNGEVKVENLKADVYLTWENNQGTNITEDVVNSVARTRIYHPTVFVKKVDGVEAPNIYVCDNSWNAMTDWNDPKETQTVTLDNQEWWYRTFNVDTEKYKVILHKEKKNGTDQSNNFENLEGDTYLDWNFDDPKKSDYHQFNTKLEKEDKSDSLFHTTVFVKKGDNATAPAVHMWGGHDTKWDADAMTDEATLNGTAYWYQTFYLRPKTYGLLLHRKGESGDGQSNDIKDASGNGTFKGNIYLTWDDKTPKNSAYILPYDETKVSYKRYTLYVKYTSDKDSICFNAWDSSALTDGGWWEDEPNNKVNWKLLLTNTVTIDGQKWWYKTLTLHKDKDKYNFQLFAWKQNATTKKWETYGLYQRSDVAEDLYLTWNPTSDITTDVKGGKTDNYTVFVKKPTADATAPYAYAWGDGQNYFGAWPGTELTDTVERNGITWWYKTVRVNKGNKYSVKLHQTVDGTDKEGANYENLTRDIYLTWDAVNGVSTDTTVYIGGNWKKYTVYVRKDSETEAAPSLNAYLSSDGTLLNGEKNADAQQMTDAITVNDKTYWYKTFLISASDKYNVQLYNSDGGGTIYTDLTDDIFLVWDANAHASTDITSVVNGKGGVTEKTDYTKGYVKRLYTAYVHIDKDAAWQQDETHAVHAFVWNSDLAPQFNYAGSWPGQTMTKVTVDGEDYYAWSYIGTQATAPKNIIFNYWDGTSKLKDDNSDAANVLQTEDLTFEDGKLYNLSSKLNANGKYILDSVTEATAELTKAYAKAVFGTSHVIFYRDKNNVNWQNVSVSVWTPYAEKHGSTDGKVSGSDNYYVSTDYAGGHNTAEGSDGGGQRMTATVMKGQAYYVWNYSGDVKDAPTKVMFHNDSPSASSNVFDYVEGGVYVLDKDGKALDPTTTDENGKAKADPDLCALNALYQRTFTPNTYSTVCLPFTLTEGDMIDLNVKLYKFKGSDNNMLTFLRSTDNTLMLYPYLMLYDGQNPANIFFRQEIANNENFADRATLATGSGKAGVEKTDGTYTGSYTWDNDMQSYKVTIGDWTFHGNGSVNTIIKSNEADKDDKGVIINDNPKAYFGYNAADNTFTWVENGRASIAPTVCWFDVLKSKIGGNVTMDANAKKMNVRLYEYESEVPTGISLTPALSKGEGDADTPSYNMVGQRVGKDYKGIVIQNGRKVIRR